MTHNIEVSGVVGNAITLTCTTCHLLVTVGIGQACPQDKHPVADTPK